MENFLVQFSFANNHHHCHQSHFTVVTVQGFLKELQGMETYGM